MMTSPPASALIASAIAWRGYRRRSLNTSGAVQSCRASDVMVPAELQHAYDVEIVSEASTSKHSRCNWLHDWQVPPQQLWLGMYIGTAGRALVCH